METKGDFLLSIEWDWSLNDDGIGPNCDIVRAKKEDLACAWVKV